jgi:hypothetical protein
MHTDVDEDEIILGYDAMSMVDSGVLEELVATTLGSLQSTKSDYIDPAKMEAARSSKTLVNMYLSSWCHIPEELNVHSLLTLSTVMCKSRLAIHPFGFQNYLTNVTNLVLGSAL